MLTPLPSRPDLATLPWPDRRGEPAAYFDHRISPLVISRGCYVNCTFCCIAAWHERTLPGKRYRVREPDDVAAEMVEIQRVYLGIETDSEQGLETLRRWARPKQNHRAIDVVRQLDLYCCFNMLAFDPDTTLESLYSNLEFMRHACATTIAVGLRLARSRRRARVLARDGRVPRAQLRCRRARPNDVTGAP